MSEITPWTVMSKGVIAFSCVLQTPETGYNELILEPLTCWNIRLDMLIGIILLFPCIYQLRMLYLYYEQQLFKARQRLILICISSIILSILSYSVLNIFALHNLAVFVLQSLFCALLCYFTSKVSRFTSGWIVKTMYIANFAILLAFAVHLIMTMITSYDSGELLCPGFLEKDYSIFKVVLLGILIVLFAICGFTLNKLLTLHRDSVLEEKDKEKKEAEIFKLRIMILAISISELAQLIFILHHLNYYSSQVPTCPMDELLEGGVGNNFVAFFYRAFTVYIPLIMIIWTLWVPKNKVSIVFKESFSEERFDQMSRFASRLSFNVKRQGSPKKAKVALEIPQNSIAEEVI